MKSLVTVDYEMAQEPIWGMLRGVDEETWEIKRALAAFQVNPNLIPRVVRAIANIAWGTGFGKVQIFMENGRVSMIKPEESDKVDKPALKIDNL